MDARDALLRRLAPFERFGLDGRFVLFLLVGGLNTLFGYALFAALVALGLAMPLAVFVSTALGVLFNFRTTGGIVFRNRDNRLLARFFAGYAVIYVLNVGALHALSAAGLDLYRGAAVLILPLAVLSFLINKCFVFRESP